MILLVKWIPIWKVVSLTNWVVYLQFLRRPSIFMFHQDTLTDLLKSQSGQSTQQHIHERLIEKAKVILSTTRLTIVEIAYQLGFEHPQSFNKIFKRYTNLSPNVFRKSFN